MSAEALVRVLKVEQAALKDERRRLLGARSKLGRRRDAVKAWTHGAPGSAERMQQFALLDKEIKSVEERILANKVVLRSACGGKRRRMSALD